LCKFYSSVLDAYADLSGIPHERPRPFRLVSDIQLVRGAAILA